MVDVHLVRGSIKRLYGESLIGMKEIDGNSINQHFVLFVRPYSFKNPSFSCCFTKKVPIQPKECLSHRHQQSKPGDVRAAF